MNPKILVWKCDCANRLTIENHIVLSLNHNFTGVILIYYLSLLADKYEFLSYFRLFNSLLFRSIAAMTFSLILSLIVGHFLIDKLYFWGFRDQTRAYMEYSESSKAGTPSMGGLIIIFTLICSILLWAKIHSMFVILCLISIIWFGFLGFKDDLDKVKHKNSDSGMSQKMKILLQMIFAVFLIYILRYNNFTAMPDVYNTTISIPFLKHTFQLDLGLFHPVFIVVAVLGIANAVNFADGLDGLTIVPSITTIIVYGIFAYIIGNIKFSNYLLFSYVPDMGELTVVAAAMFGAGLGFLWYNCYPATVFMGDTGAMAIGGLLATMVILTRQEFLFLISGGIFVAEAFSVLVQQKIGINIIGKRIFYRAPLHHSFQHIGMSETKIVVRFWIVSIILALISLATLKVR